MTPEQLAALTQIAEKAQIGDSHVANGAHIVAFNPATCLALLEEVERLRRDLHTLTKGRLFNRDQAHETEY